MLKEDERFDVSTALENEQSPVYFAEEMVFSWMAEDISHLRPLNKYANSIARERIWSKIYNVREREKEIKE